MNRTLVKTTRTMVLYANLPHKFWAEAQSTATYLWNRSPTKAVCGMTPHEAWTGEKPQVDRIQVFRCQAFVIPKGERKKLDSKSRRCILLGYGMNTKGYRLYDPLKKKVFHSRDVIFNEQKSGFEESSQAQKEPQPLVISNVQMNPQTQLSRPYMYLLYNDLNVKGDSPTSMVFGVTCLICQGAQVCQERLDQLGVYKRIVRLQVRRSVRKQFTFVHC